MLVLKILTVLIIVMLNTLPILQVRMGCLILSGEEG